MNIQGSPSQRWKFDCPIATGARHVAHCNAALTTTLTTKTTTMTMMMTNIHRVSQRRVFLLVFPLRATSCTTGRSIVISSVRHFVNQTMSVYIVYTNDDTTMSLNVSNFSRSIQHRQMLCRVIQHTVMVYDYLYRKHGYATNYNVWFHINHAQMVGQL